MILMKPADVQLLVVAGRTKHLLQQLVEEWCISQVRQYKILLTAFNLPESALQE
jgi:hypothetical protein